MCRGWAVGMRRGGHCGRPLLSRARKVPRALAVGPGALRLGPRARRPKELRGECHHALLSVRARHHRKAQRGAAEPALLAPAVPAAVTALINVVVVVVIAVGVSAKGQKLPEAQLIKHRRRRRPGIALDRAARTGLAAR